MMKNRLRLLHFACFCLLCSITAWMPACQSANPTQQQALQRVNNTLDRSIAMIDARRAQAIIDSNAPSADPATQMKARQQAAQMTEVLNVLTSGKAALTLAGGDPTKQGEAIANLMGQIKGAPWYADVVVLLVADALEQMQQAKPVLVPPTPAPSPPAPAARSGGP